MTVNTEIPKFEKDWNKPIVPLNQAYFVVSIRKTYLQDKSYTWDAQTKDNVGMTCYITKNNFNSCSSIDSAITDWEQFAMLNMILNYEIRTL